MSALLNFYYVQAKTSVIAEFQYRVAQFFWLLGMMAEPVIYLVVWSAVARAQGGSVGGYTPGQFAAYYIGWTLVRHMNIALTPYNFEWRIKEGRLAAELLAPLHPFHRDLGWFMGMKVMTIVLWLPVAAALTLIFKPELHPQPWMVAGFAVSVVTAFIMRFALLWALGLVTFWVTRVSAIFELYFAIELLLSGRLVPMALMPQWAQTLANYLPFRWAFGFQLELLLGRLTPQQTAIGFAAQAFWFVLAIVVIRLMWRAALKKFSAVGA